MSTYILHIEPREIASKFDQQFSSYWQLYVKVNSQGQTSQKSNQF